MNKQGNEFRKSKADTWHGKEEKWFMKNDFCDVVDLKNEATVESWFIQPLLNELEYTKKDIDLKMSIREFKIGKGSKSVLYKPDYILKIDGIPTVVIDAKSPTEDIRKWEHQCSSYCLELNKLFDYNPVQYFMLTNGLVTSIYQWDIKSSLMTINFSDFIKGNPDYKKLRDLIGRSAIKTNTSKLKNSLENSSFKFEKISLVELIQKFQKMHQYIWTKEKKSPSAAFEELIKIIFVKIQKDREIYSKLGKLPSPKFKDVVFSSHWIVSQTENESPINDPLFKNLVHDMEVQIQDGNRKRFFDKNEQINLHEETIKWIVKEIENIDFYGMEEDIHGRLFEAFLDATVRGRELGQFFTPRDIVDLMVKLAFIQVTKNKINLVLDACCGSGGFLISAMRDMLKKNSSLAGLSNLEREHLSRRILDKSIFGIDAGSDPAIYRIARMNMYLHGDGGSNIYFADALDKTLGKVSQSDIEHNKELQELRKLILEDKIKFDVILSNPSFSMKYSRDDPYQAEILSQYAIPHDNSLLSSVMFLERYKDLVSDDGKILAIIDESILSGQSYIQVRNFIRDNFILIGVISLPGDAFRRASARVKTSILVLRLRKSGEIQPDVFMASAVFVGLEEKIARRIGINKKNLQEEKLKEIDDIVDKFSKFASGIPGSYLVPAHLLADRLDVKYCINDRGRKKSIWLAKGYQVARIGQKLSIAPDRQIKVSLLEAYQFLKVTYDGEVIEGDLIEGEDCSYRTLFVVKERDILLSNMGVGRGAVGIVPPFHSGKFVSNEYTILRATTKEEAVYYCNLLRTKEILGDILSTTTGMNRGRIKWSDIANVEIPAHEKGNKDIEQLALDLSDFWAMCGKFYSSKISHMNNVTDNLEVEGMEAHKRWLAYKPPE